MMTAGELAALRSTQHDALDQTCVISRFARSAKDIVGGNANTWTPDTGVPTRCRIGEAKGEELRVLAKEADVEHAQYLGTFATGATAEHPPPVRHDRLISVSDGHTYEVEALVDSPSYSTAVRCQLRRLT